MINRIFVFLISMAAWLVLTWSREPGSLVVGLIASLIVALVFGKMLRLNLGKAFSPMRYFWFVVYVLVLAWEMIKANLDVAYRVLHPELPINPGIVKIKTNLTNELAQTMLANSITLTPGTMSVDLIGANLYIHWINVREKEVEAASQAIAGRFEKILARVFE
ncbi:Na+/H+ antiporter subunit E [Candidatus Margulisiibacteriota bacterium]